MKELVHDCSVKKVPFPALETFENRIMFPKRYFLFFDMFVRAGRHNRFLWKKAIRENKGLNDMRFGPPIFEAHVRTTVRENYFKWIFQQLSDIDEVEDQHVADFQMEYDEEVYNDLPRTLVCTHEELTKFPHENCEIQYGEEVTAGTADNTDSDEEPGKEDDIESYCSANSVDPAAPSPTTTPRSAENKFLLVYRNVDIHRFKKSREQQRKDLKRLLEKASPQHEEIVKELRKAIGEIRVDKKTTQETDMAFKHKVAGAKKKLRLFKDQYDEDIEGPMRKKRRRSVENKTRFSDSKVAFFSKSNDEMKREEQEGIRKSWEALYKEIWNKHLLAPKNPVIDIPIPQVNTIIRDMETDVNQLLADCAGMVEQV